MSIVGSDSSPLISLAILDKLSILKEVFAEIWIPFEVFKEITKQNKLYSKELRLFFRDKVKHVRNNLAVQLLQKVLDPGESEVIILAKESGIKTVLIDESKGRKIARENSLLPIGTIGVLIQAKNLGVIENVKPEMDKLIANHRRISIHLYKKALELANEK